MKNIILCLILTTYSFSSQALEDFPEKQLRRAFAETTLAKLMTELRKQEIKSGLEFDPAVALTKCDAVDSALTPRLVAKRKLFYSAKAAREASQSGWDKELRAALMMEDTKSTLLTALNEEQKKWNCLRTQISLCNDAPSLELLEIIAADSAVLDETVMSTCIRTIKMLKKAGTCTYTQDVIDSACKSSL